MSEFPFLEDPVFKEPWEAKAIELALVDSL